MKYQTICESQWEGTDIQEELDNGGLSWREAHGPRSYYEQMAKDGVR